MSASRAEQRIVAQVSTDAEKTVRAWTDLPSGCLDVDWGEVGLLALQHRVEGLLHESLELAGCRDQVPVSVLSLLRRRAELAETRYRACYDVLVELARRAPDLVSEMAFFKGAGMATRYGSPAHRMVGDFDFIVSSEHAGELRALFGELDFWEKPGRNGPTYFGSALKPQIGSEYVVFDVHLDAPPKYNRPEPSRGALWLESAVPDALGEIACRRLPAELELLELLTHASEHALSWVHVCLDDDVRLIRQLDVELLCEQEPIDPAAVAALADRLGLAGELALGLAIHRSLRGALPAALEHLRDRADAVGDLVDVVALPDGRQELWEVPLHERAYRTDRGALALAMMPEGQRDRSHWFDWRKGLIRGSEDVAAVARLATDRLAATTGVG